MSETTPLKLYEISAELDRITMEVMESGGEITPELEAALEEMEGSFLDKVEHIALRIREIEATADGAKAEKDRLYAIEKAHRNTARRMKLYLMEHMGRRGQDYVQTMKCRVRVQDNPNPSISWTGELGEIPEDYRKVEIKPNLALLKDDLKVGADLPDGFTMSFGRHLRIY